MTHIGQNLKLNAKQQYYDFYKKLYNLRNQIGDYDNYQNLFNMDETPIWFEMVSKTTVEKIGEKSVNVTTFGSERSRISLILSICANGQKLPPLVVFKGKKNGNIEKRLRKYVLNKKEKIFVACQENSWADKEIFFYWLEEIFFNNKINSNETKKILIMDRATTHYDENLKNWFKKFKSYFILIPPGLTRYIQPLDVSINGPLKKNASLGYLLSD